MEMTIKINIPTESLEEMLVTALEGGINYWGCLDGEDISVFQKWFDEKIEAGELKRDESIHYKWMDAMFQGCPHKIAVYDVEEYDEVELEPLGYLSMEKISEGLQLAMRDYPKVYAQHFPEYESGDVISADVLFQLIVMGDVVYG
jgi:hypothetical protein|tara:strand:+ start:198 stop:632 length:435 start_codon:yes stop_codon:yes gene_type:complete